MSRLARDVATELVRRQRRRRLLVLSLLAAAIAAAILYLRCGAGWGFGPGGDGAASGSAAKTAAPPDARSGPCAIRLDAGGLTVDGTAATVAEAVAACRAAGRADVVVTGDARQGDWDALRQALDEAGVPHGMP